MDSVTEKRIPGPYTLWGPETNSPLPLIVILPEAQDTPEEAQGKAAAFLEEDFQKAHPCFVLLAACDIPWSGWEKAALLEETIFDLEESRPEIDGCRVYLIGGSQAWDVGSRFPRRFAAVVPLEGWGDPYAARSLKHTPVWAFYRDEDSAVKRGNPLLASPARILMGLRTWGARQARGTRLSPSAQGSWERVFTENQGKETVDWLFAQNRKTQFQVEYIQPGVFRIDDYFTSSCYLVCGGEKALLIDTGMGEGDLPALVRSLTSLPVEVAITHPHRDHVAQADGFSRVYLHEKDVARLEEYQKQMEGFFGDKGPAMPAREKLIPLKDGDRIDLGGGVTVETAQLPGHTENSVVFIDDFHQSVFTGDAIGSGYIALMICPQAQWRQLIAQYKEGLEKFRRHLPRLEDYAWLGGHFIQENGCNMRRQEDFLSGESAYFCPISAEVARDMEALCEKLLSGEISEKELLSSPEHYCSWKSAGIYFRFVD